MTQTAAFEADDLEPVSASESGGRLRETIVQFSIVIVVVAFGAALRTTLGFSLASAIAIAVVSYWGLLLVHAVVRRGYDIAELSAEVADLADENSTLRRLVERRPGRGDDAPPARLPVGGADRFGVPVGITRGAPGGPVMAPPKNPGHDGAVPTLAMGRAGVAQPARGADIAERAAPKGGPDASAPGPQTKAQAAARAAAGAEAIAARATGVPPAGGRATPPLASPPPPLAPLGPSAGERKGAALSRGAKGPVAPAPVAASKPSAAADDDNDEMELLASGAADPRAQDIAMMQSLIKGLADQINGPTVPVVAPGQAKATIAPSDVAHGDAPDAIDAQVGALREAATALRAPEGRAGAMPDRHDHGMLERLAGAVDAARIDVYLDPILGLDDHKARHYEVSVQLRDEDGVLLDPSAFAGTIAGTGLWPRIDGQAVVQSARLAGQIAARGSNASLFSSVSGESIRDGAFHEALVGALTPDAAVASRLVMSVAQSEIRAFGPAHWEALAAMSESGLRYALVDVVDLDVDFEGLKQYGFDFIRLDAQVFLDGLPGPHGVVPAADLCRYLSHLGFSLIVGRIGDERELVKVFGFGALLGQGRLFGAPRPIKVDRSAVRTSAA